MSRAAVLLLLLAGAAPAQVRVLELEAPEEIRYLVHRDLDGDGLEEILAIDGWQVRWWRGRNDGPSPQPDATLALPEGAALFDVGPPGGSQRLIVRTPSGYWALAPGAAPEKLPYESGPGLPEMPDNVLWRGFFRDFDRDGRTDFLDVSLEGYRIRFAGGERVTLPARVRETLETRAFAASEGLRARYALGDWTEGDFDGDGNNDFALVGADGLRVHTGDAQGRFDPERSRALPLEETADADLSFLDFNVDGRMDVLAVRRGAGEAVLLIGDAERGLFAPHRQRLRFPGEVRFPVMDDLDGNGLPDLAFPYTTRPSVQDAVRVLVRGEVLLKVPVFLNRGGERPLGRLADRQLVLPIRIRVGTDDAGRIRLSGLVIVEYSADLDGDGRRDLLVTVKPDLLAVHRGVERGVFEEEEAGRIAIPDSAPFDTVRSAAARLNDDDRSDIILHYRGAGRRPDRVYLLLSGKE